MTEQAPLPATGEVEPTEEGRRQIVSSLGACAVSSLIEDNDDFA